MKVTGIPINYCSSCNSCYFLDDMKLILKYVHRSGIHNIQPTQTNYCKDFGVKFIVAGISSLRPGSKASKNLSSLFGHFEIDKGNPLHLLEKELLSEPMIIKKIRKLKLY